MDSESVDLKNESNRLATFIGWPISFIVSPKSLASAGFYYTKQIDKVKCAFCHICVCRWEFGDNAVDEHKRHNPTCTFILSQNCGNIPIIEGIQLRGEFVETHKESGVPIDIRGLGVRTHRVAFHLKYNSYCARIKTFRTWKNEALKPEELALAGFFFTGSNDEVRCYYCDGGLQNWEEADNPWVEHAKWFPNCGFLNLVQGEKFLDGNLVERFNALLNRPRSDDPTLSQEVVSIHETDNVSPDDASYLTRRVETTDQEIDELMLLPPAINALELGLQTSHIRQAIRNNLQDIGRPFRPMDSFIRQILNQDQSLFAISDDSTTLEEILRREGQTWQTNTVNDHNIPSEEYTHSITRFHENEEDFIRYVTTYNENDMHISSDDEELTEIINQSRIRLREIEASTIDNSLVVENAADLVISESDNTSIGNRNIVDSYDDNIEPESEPEPESKPEPEPEPESEPEPEPEPESQSMKLSHSDLEEENRKLKEARLCKICLDQELGVVMLPCAHLVACITCASSLPDCPLCRQTIKATVRTFLS